MLSRSSEIRLAVSILFLLIAIREKTVWRVRRSTGSSARRRTVGWRSSTVRIFLSLSSRCRLSATESIVEAAGTKKVDMRMEDERRQVRVDGRVCTQKGFLEPLLSVLLLPMCYRLSDILPI